MSVDWESNIPILFSMTNKYAYVATSPQHALIFDFPPTDIACYDSKHCWLTDKLQTMFVALKIPYSLCEEDIKNFLCL